MNNGTDIPGLFTFPSNYWYEPENESRVSVTNKDIPYFTDLEFSLNNVNWQNINWNDVPNNPIANINEVYLSVTPQFIASMMLRKKQGRKNYTVNIGGQNASTKYYDLLHVEDNGASLWNVVKINFKKLVDNLVINNNTFAL